MNALCGVNAVFGTTPESSPKNVRIRAGAAGSVLAIGQPLPVNRQEVLLSDIPQQAISCPPPGRSKHTQVPTGYGRADAGKGRSRHAIL